MRQKIKDKFEKDSYNNFIRKESIAFQGTKQEMLDDTIPNKNPYLSSSDNIDEDNNVVEKKEKTIIDLPLKKRLVKLINKNSTALIIGAIIIPFLGFYFFNYVEYRENIAIIKNNIEHLESNASDLTDYKLIKAELDEIKKEINDNLLIDIKDIQKRITILETKIELQNH